MLSVLLPHLLEMEASLESLWCFAVMEPSLLVCVKDIEIARD